MEGMGVVRSIIFSDDLFCIFPQIEVFKTDDGTILFSNCDYENIGDGDNLTEITESDLIRDPRIWVKVAKRFKRWVYPCLAILQYQGK